MPFLPYGTLYQDAYSTPAMRATFSEERFVEAFLEVEAALARAQARAGIVPESAAETLTERARVEYVDEAQLVETLETENHMVLPIIEGWRVNLGEAGRYVHWGATTQDIVDTALVLLLEEALASLRADLARTKAAFAELAVAHRETPIVGRTHFVHAVPLTFGLKLAVWVAELDRHEERLDELAKRALVAQFFGATGTLASLGDAGLDVQRYFGEELDLAVPAVTWHTARDGFAELVNTLAELGATASKVARQLLFMNRPEVGEVTATVGGGITSSAMPHKRTPKLASRILSLAMLARGYAGAMTEVMQTDDERSMANWYAEFVAIPEACMVAGRTMANLADVAEDLEVHPERMADNLRLHGTIVTSERVMMALADHYGRPEAHDLVREHTMAAFDTGVDFAECLRGDERVTSVLSEARITELTDPLGYVGEAATMVDRVIERHTG